jgi:hypothetical protein
VQQEGCGSFGKERHGIFHFGDHLERVADFDDVLIVDVRHRDGAAAAWAAWNSGIAGAIRDYVPTGDPLSDEDPGAGTWVARVPLPSTVEPILGKHARIQLTVTPRS